MEPSLSMFLMRPMVANTLEARGRCMCHKVVLPLTTSWFNTTMTNYGPTPYTAKHGLADYPAGLQNLASPAWHVPWQV